MAVLDAKMSWGWYGEYKRENGVCVPCENLSFYQENGELKSWATNIASVNQFSGTSRSKSLWSAKTHKTQSDLYESQPEGLRGDKLIFVKVPQSITELRCGVPYSITKKVRTTPVTIDGFVIGNLSAPDAGRVVECEDCPDIPDCVC